MEPVFSPLVTRRTKFYWIFFWDYFRCECKPPPWEFLKEIFTHWKQSFLITKIYVFWVVHYTVNFLVVWVVILPLQTFHTVNFQRLGTKTLWIKKYLTIIFIANLTHVNLIFPYWPHQPRFFFIFRANIMVLNII